MSGPSLGFLQGFAPLLQPDAQPYLGAPLAPPPESPQDAGQSLAIGPPQLVPKTGYDFNADLANALGAPPPKPPDAAPVAPAGTMPFGLGLATGTPQIDISHADAAPAREPEGVAPMAPTPAAPPMAAPPPAAVPAPAPAPDDVQFAALGGVSSPAGEMYARGPQQHAALMSSFEPQAEAATRSDLRSQITAAHEADVYEQQAEAAMERQAAIERTAARRQEEMDRAIADYQQSVQQLGQMHLDSNRWWADKSTGDKIGTAILTVIGGIGAGFGGPNLAYQSITRKIDQDIAAQKFDYDMGLDRAKGAQNTFAMLMNKYGSEDAASAAARAAALDFAAAKTMQLGAQWKGTASANDADQLRASLEAERQKTLANGFRFIPPSVSAPRYALKVRGQLLPGTVSEAQAQQIALEHGVKPAEAADQEMLRGGVQLTVNNAKAAAEKESKADEGAKFIAEKLQSGGVPKMRSLAEQALTALHKSPGGLAAAAVRVLPATRLAADRLDPEGAEREQSFQAFANLNMNQLSGGAISPAEEVRLKAQLGSAYNPASRERAIKAVLQSLDEAERNVKAGASPEAQAEFDRRRQAASGGAPAAPKGSVAGWK